MIFRNWCIISFATFSFNIWCIIKLLFFSHTSVNLLSHSNRERMLVTVNKNNESWKKLNLAQQLTEKLETFDHTWLNKIKQKNYMKSSFSNLWVKCTLVHLTFQAQWKHSPKKQQHFTKLNNYFLTNSSEFLFCTTPKSSKTPCEVNEGWRVTWATTFNVLLHHVSVYGRHATVFFQKQTNQGQITTSNIHILNSSVKNSCLLTMEVKRGNYFFLYFNFALPSL